MTTLANDSTILLRLLRRWPRKGKWLQLAGLLEVAEVLGFEKCRVKLVWSPDPGPPHAATQLVPLASGTMLAAFREGSHMTKLQHF